MMVDLITDFKDVIENSTKNSISELNETFKSLNLDKNKTFVKNINKFYMAIAMWHKYLKDNISDNNRDILLDNILLDFCSLLNCIILGDEKLIKFLYRNIIESILRYITLKLDSRDIDTMFKDISLDCNGTIEKKLLQEYSSVLKSIYNDTCLYVHTDISKITPSLTDLMKYNKNGKKLRMDKLLNDFNNLNVSILCIFQIKYYDIYLSFKGNVQGLINEVIPLEDRIKLSDFEKERKQNNK